jgi:hypothetical protein
MKQKEGGERLIVQVRVMGGVRRLPSRRLGPRHRPEGNTRARHEENKRRTRGEQEGNKKKKREHSARWWLMPGLMLAVRSRSFGLAFLVLWVYDLVVICLGMTSACILPASVPLLIFWLKPEVKSHFGKN